MGSLTALVAVGLLGATVKKVTDFPAQIAAGDRNAVIKQVISWVVGVAGAFVLAHSDLAAGVVLTDGLTLASANPATIIWFGFSVASGASVALVDGLAAIDNTRSSKVPNIVPDNVPAAGAPGTLTPRP